MARFHLRSPGLRTANPARPTASGAGPHTGPATVRYRRRLWRQGQCRATNWLPWTSAGSSRTGAVAPGHRAQIHRKRRISPDGLPRTAGAAWHQHPGVPPEQRRPFVVATKTAFEPRPPRQRVSSLATMHARTRHARDRTFCIGGSQLCRTTRSAGDHRGTPLTKPARAESEFDSPARRWSTTAASTRVRGTGRRRRNSPAALIDRLRRTLGGTG